MIDGPVNNILPFPTRKKTKSAVITTGTTDLRDELLGLEKGEKESRWARKGTEVLLSESSLLDKKMLKMGKLELSSLARAQLSLLFELRRRKKYLQGITPKKRI